MWQAFSWGSPWGTLLQFRRPFLGGMVGANQSMKAHWEQLLQLLLTHKYHRLHHLPLVLVKGNKQSNKQSNKAINKVPFSVPYSRTVSNLLESFCYFGYRTLINLGQILLLFIFPFFILFYIIIQLSYTVRIPIFWLVDLYHVILGCDKTTSLTSLSWCKFNTPLSSLDHGFGELKIWPFFVAAYSIWIIWIYLYSFNNKEIEILNTTFGKASCSIEISRLLLVNSCR